MKYKPFNLITALTLAFSSLLSFSSYAAQVDSQGNTKVVNSAVWQKKSDVNAQQLMKPISGATTNESVINLFFIRPNVAAASPNIERNSVNIAVNDRFQVSLQPGNFSQVYSCTGINQISAVSTAQKTNDLSQNANVFELKEGGDYFFYIDGDDEDKLRITQITPNSATKILPNRRFQKHQISRVVPKCVVSQ